MAKQRDAVSTGVAALYREIRSVLEQARASAYRAVNFAMVQAYWQVGHTLPAQVIRDAVRHKSTVTDTEAVT